MTSTSPFPYATDSFDTALRCSLFSHVPYSPRRPPLLRSYLPQPAHGLQLLPNPGSGLGNGSGTRRFVLSFMWDTSLYTLSFSSVPRQHPLSSLSPLVRYHLLTMRIIFSNLEEPVGRGYDFYNAHAMNPDP